MTGRRPVFTLCIAQDVVATLTPSMEVAPVWRCGNKGTISKLPEAKQTLRCLPRNTIRTDECHGRNGDLERRVSVLLGNPYKVFHPLVSGWSRGALTMVTGAKRPKMQAVSAEMPAKRASDCYRLPMPRLHRMQGSPLHASSGRRCR